MKVLCPIARVPGRRVSELTVRSLVREDRTEEASGSSWYFCEVPDCDVVYFADDGTTFGKEDLKVRVGIKEAEGPHTMCYCFDHTVESIHEEIERTGESTVFASISERVKAGECSCEVLNPKGTCCLGDVSAVVKEALASTGSECNATPGEADSGHSCCGGGR